MENDLNRRLEALGRAKTGELTDERLVAIEARVMQATHDAPARRRVAVVLAMAAAIVLLVAGLVLTSGASEPRLAAAEGVTLERPGDSAAPGEVGDELPDGTVIVIVAGGTAEVSGDRYGPGRYVMIGGRLEPLASSPSTSASTSPSTSTIVRRAAPPADRTTVSPGGTSTTRPPRPDRTTTPPRRDRTATTSIAPRPSTTVIDRPRPDQTTTLPVDRTTLASSPVGPSQPPDQSTTTTPTADRRRTTTGTTTTATTTTSTTTTTTTTTTEVRDRDDRP